MESQWPWLGQARFWSEPIHVRWAMIHDKPVNLAMIDPKPYFLMAKSNIWLMGVSIQVCT